MCRVPILPPVLPAISSDFNAFNQASWLGTSYLLATCTFTPLYGRLCNVLGRRAANHSALCFAAAGILACGLSKSMTMLVASRFISGMGGGGIFTTSQIITSDMYTIRSRGYIQSVAGVFYGAGMGLGGPLGGFITDWLGWRWAFLMQIPLFALSLMLTFFNLSYTTPGTGVNTKDILRRIDYGGSFTLLGFVGSTLLFLSLRYNEGRPWGDSMVLATLLLACFLLLLFLEIEFHFAIEPILPSFLLTEKIPVLVGLSNALVAVTNLSVTYFFPMYFQTVMLSSASMAGLHLLPSTFCISTGSIFAGWIMKKTGHYKMINLTFGILPFCAAVLLTQMKENSNQAHLWLSIMPFGFGNAVVLQTMYIALVANLPDKHMAVGTGFAQLLRGLGQVGGLALSSAVFQSRLDTELKKRLRGLDSEGIINKIRHSSRVIGSLPPDLQRVARDSYAASIKTVFILAACASLLAYLLRLPIPDKVLEDKPSVGSDDRIPESGENDTESVSETSRDDLDDEDKPQRNRVRSNV
uniref:Putative vacuolar amino acid permease n=1 Tax=Moniliophthora roreri TaxID=221103 RepID=A0A0W0GDB7_MONRR